MDHQDSFWVEPARRGDAHAFRLLLDKYRRQIEAVHIRVMVTAVVVNKPYFMRLGLQPVDQEDRAPVGKVRAEASCKEDPSRLQ
jgi:hypothetical protein